MARIAVPKKKAVSELDQMLAEDAARFFHDPTGFTQYAYPWGEPESPLEDYPGPDDWQAEVMDYIGQQTRTAKTAIRVAISSGHGIGKEIACTEPVYTPSGPVAMGELKVGDWVLGGDGKPCRVLGVWHQGVRPLYRVTFSDGASVLAGDPHLWVATSVADRHYKRPARVVTTGEMRTHLYRKYQIPLCGPAGFNISNTYIHPYIIGYLLGNGSLCTPSAIKISCHDTEAYARISDNLPDGYALRGCTDTYQFISRPGKFNGDDGGNEVWRYLDALGVTYKKAHEKFIPEEYLYGTVDERVELLRGLMDSDGCCINANEKGRPNHYRVTFNTSSPLLRDGFIQLIRSLGGISSYNTDSRRGVKLVNGYGRTNVAKANFDNYQLSVNLPKGINPFYITRKASVYEEYLKTNKRNPIRAVRSIEYECDDYAACIMVDSPDHTYLTKDYIVTHNSALASYLINWFMTTRPDCAVVATANTKTQLQTKLWRELALWHKRSLFEPWFQWMATSLRAIEAPETWVANAIPWSVNNPEAFAGLHGQYVLVIFDEASAVDDIIWETMEGAMTTAGYIPIWVVQGNPTRSSGGFYRCFHDPNSPWKTFQIDSRTARMTNKAQLQEWIERWGADSNFAKVRIYGQFPTIGDLQFIPTDLVDRALANKSVAVENDYLVLGVDIGHRGSDPSMIVPRTSNRVLKPRELRIPDTMVLAATIADAIDELHPDTTFIDGNGIGAGVVDRLRQLGYDVIDVLGQSKPLDERYYNKRAECYGGVKAWLRGDVDLFKDDELREELVGLEYDLRRDRVLLEDKDDIRDRIGRSPNKADALALTFAEPLNVIRMRRAEAAMQKLGTYRTGRDWRAV